MSKKINRRDEQRLQIQAMSQEERTTLYWNVAMAQRREGPLKGITTEQAISFLADIEAYTSITSPLGDKVSDLLDNVVGVPKAKNKVNAYRRWPNDDGPRAA